MAVPLSKLKDTIKAAMKAVTGATEELFAEGVRLGAIGEGITFTVEVFDDSAPMNELTETVDETPELRTKEISSTTPPSTSQQQSFGRSTESTVRYTS